MSKKEQLNEDLLSIVFSVKADHESNEIIMNINKILGSPEERIIPVKNAWSNQSFRDLVNALEAIEMSDDQIRNINETFQYAIDKRK